MIPRIKEYQRKGGLFAYEAPLLPAPIAPLCDSPAAPAALSPVAV